MIDVNDVKNRIIGYLEENGLSLPVRIAKAVKMEPVFTSAILSELLNSKKVKCSNFRLGSSCFYFLRGQESGLEMVGDEHLKGVEKDVFLLLRDNKVLKDSEQAPAVRVALRSLKDFAIPFKFEEEVYWRYSLIDREEIRNKMEGKVLVKNEIIEEEKVDVVENIIEEIQLENTDVEDVSNDIIHEVDSDATEDIIKKFESPFKNIKNEGKYIETSIEEIKPTEFEIKNKSFEHKMSFLEEVKCFLNKKEVRLYEIVVDSRNEVVGKIKIGSDFGDIVFLVVARNKKNLTHPDILMAKTKADEFKMPLFLISKGTPGKKIQGILEEYSNLIKFESMIQ